MNELVVERRGPVQVFRINRPDARNALSREVLQGLGNGIADADGDPEVRAIVITGTGDRAFCAGLDLREFSGRGGGGGQREATEAYMRFIRHGCRTPVVGAANATAVGGGLELLLACDMVVASDHARFGLPEVKRGLFPAGGGVMLARRIARGPALELVLTGETVDAQRAAELGLVNRVVAPERVLDEAVELASVIAANGPLAVAVAKELVRLAADTDPATTWERQEALSPSVFGSEDAKEGAQAFIERREPRWTGR
jgi:enoyl-CoA hydratase/carnithine racemase